jgi:multidrug efflux pump subunit AcrA (membrane-fusion protein)
MIGFLAAPVSCSRDAKPVLKDAEHVPIQVRTPAAVERPDSVSASGSVEGSETADVAFQLAGRVARVLVEEGQGVRRGQLLAELEPVDYVNALNAAAAQKDAAQAVAQKAEAGLRKQELEQARIDLDRWQDEYKRMQFLFERKSLPPNDFHKVEAAYQAARQRYEMAQQGARVEDRAAAQAQARAADAQASEAKKRLDDTGLRAPISGYVAMRRINAGQTVAAGMPVLSIVDLNPAKVRVGVPEAGIGKVRQGAAAEISVPSLGGRRFAGRVELVGVAADPMSRTYTVKISVPNPGQVLLAGMVAEARILSASTVRALTIPGEAIVRDAQGASSVFVYFPGQKRVYARRVETGSLLGNEVEIRSGLRGDELIVVGGQQKVREGGVVEVAGGAR